MPVNRDPHSRRLVDGEASTSTSGSTYSNLVGVIFIFNLIVGTGALTLPGVFVKAGWLLSLIVIVLLASMSYLTVTFVIETIACANAINNWQNLQVLRQRQNSEEQSEADDEAASAASRQEEEVSLLGGDSGELERIPLTIQSAEFRYYQLSKKFELGEMATLFFNDIGRTLFYLCFIVYLYGDLSIYSAAVARSLRDVVCDDRNATNYGNSNLMFWPGDFKNNTNSPCWMEHTISRLSMYRVFLIAFTVIFGPFAAFNVQKTKYLQILTAFFRWTAFSLMIGLALKILITKGARGHPVSVDFNGIPSLFGACVYSFMCHHSLPSLIAPIRQKRMIAKIISFDYIFICSFYILLALTGIFAFKHVEILYTLNFLPQKVPYTDFASAVLLGIDYFLALFPVFTLSTSYPIIAITLRNNLQTLFLDMSRYESYHWFIRIIFPLCAIIPPFCVTYFTESLSSLIAFTGSYAGTGIQYIIPVCLVYFARRTCSELLGSGVANQFKSPFKSNAWLLLVIVWSVVCVFLVTINLVQ